MLRFRRFRPRRKAIAVTKLRVIVVFILIIGFFIWEVAASSVDETVLLDASVKHFETITAEIISELADEEFTEELIYDENNSLRSLSLNSNTLLKVKTDIEQKLNNALSSSSTVWIPIGNLLPFTVTNGLGPKIPVVIGFTGSGSVNFDESFSTGGINQTVFKLNLEISAVLRVHSQHYSGEFPMNNTYTIYQIVIVGNTPTVTYTKN